jgi:hypothetical protein
MNFPQPLLELPSFELRSSKRSQGHFLHQLSSNKTQNMKTQNKKLKKLKRLKLEKRNKFTSRCVVYVSPTPTRTTKQ